MPRDVLKSEKYPSKRSLFSRDDLFIIYAVTLNSLSCKYHISKMTITNLLLGMVMAVIMARKEGSVHKLV